MNNEHLLQLQVQPRSTQELKETIHRFEEKWQRKAEASAKYQR